MKKTVLSTLFGGILMLGVAGAQAAGETSGRSGTTHHQRMMTGMKHMNERAMTEMMQRCQHVMEQE